MDPNRSKRIFVQDADLYPDRSHHKDAIENLFEINPGRIDPGLARRAAEIAPYFVCFTNRSGSNLLIDTLGRVGFSCEPGDEFFNAEAVRDHVKEFEFATFEAYLEYVIKLRSARSSIFLKVGPHQLLWLANSGMLGNYFPHARYISVERLDKIQQAVSLYIADQSGSFMRASGDAPSGRSAIPYVADEILSRVKHIVDASFLFQYFFAIHSIVPHVVTYEDLDADPVGVVERMKATLSLDLPLRWQDSVRQQAPRIMRQADALNRAFVERFQEEFSIRKVEQA